MVEGAGWQLALRAYSRLFPLSFAKNPSALLRGARHLLVVAPAGVLDKRRFPSGVLDRKLVETLLELAKDVSPGARGAAGSTLLASSGKRGSGPRWLSVAVLPKTLSRYNSPSRADSIRHAVTQVSLGRSGKVAVLLILDEAEHLLPASNAVARALPQFSAKSEVPSTRVELAAVLADGTSVTPDDRVRATVECSRDSAELVDTPPTELDPDGFAKRARELLAETKPKLKITEIKGGKLLAAGLRGIHAVGRAAATPPRLLIAEYLGAGAGAKPTDGAQPLHIALVGKGITFDTGGLHLKPRGGMEGMKADMGGAAAVLGAFRALVREGSPHRVTLLLCMAENANDAVSYKPDDISTLHSGKTVEINNTDAEGRLLLADGVSWATRELNADVVIDAATLTGAQLIATGLTHAAVVSDDADLEALAVEAGRASGDLVHPLPFAPELFQAEFSSPVADMRNSVANRSNAQTSCAAQFVYAHLEGANGARQRRWLHIDLAGPAFPKNRATGYGVALIAEIVRRLG